MNVKEDLGQPSGAGFDLVRRAFEILKLDPPEWYSDYRSSDKYTVACRDGSEVGIDVSPSGNVSIQAPVTGAIGRYETAEALAKSIKGRWKREISERAKDIVYLAARAEAERNMQGKVNATWARLEGLMGEDRARRACDVRIHGDDTVSIVVFAYFDGNQSSEVRAMRLQIDQAVQLAHVLEAAGWTLGVRE